MKLAKEGYRYILALLVLGAALCFIHTGLGVVMGVLAGFVAFFFRDPQRKAPLSDDYVLSPADGTITGVRTLQKDPYFAKPCQRISIFLSILDVHVNRSPVSGRVKQQTYYPGKFLMAFAKEAAAQNESNLLVIESEGGDVMVRQIAGKIARRIVCDVKAGDRVIQGERLGIIQFGSGVELYLPLDYDVRVKQGQKVQVGRTVMAELKVKDSRA